MPVPSTLSQLSVTASGNSPVGSEAIANNLSGYLQSHAAFIAQVANGTGINMTKALSMQNFQINNLAAGTANTDAVNYLQLKNYLPIGTVVMWWGTATQAAVTATWGSNWALMNGANGTPNILDRFPVAAGQSYGTGSAGGATSYTIAIGNMPSHTHGVADPGHAHGVADPSHAHAVADPGHNHSIPNAGSAQAGTDNGGAPVPGPTGFTTARGTYGTGNSATGIGIYASSTGIGIYGAGTGIYLGYTGGNAPMYIIPPYIGIAFVMKIANN